MIMVASILGFSSCNEAPKPLVIDNKLTAEEIAEARFTPEVMWKMGRISSFSLSPDGQSLLCCVTRYSVDENRGVTTITLYDTNTIDHRELTDTSSNNVAAKWSSDGKTIWFMSNRSGSMQLWSMQPDGSNPTQITDVEGGIEAYGVAPDQSHLYYIKSVHVKDIRSADLHKDMAKSKARIYDDLMARHWDYWDEGDYRHIFVAPITKGKTITAGEDITGADAAWDTPLAPYFDDSEIAWSNDSRYIAYTCKPLTGREYAVSTDSDIFIYDTVDKSTVNICKPDGKKVTVMASGMGQPSIGIYSYELYNFYDVDAIIRVGTCGSFHPDLHARDIIVAMGACTNGNYAMQYKLPGTFAPIADFDLVRRAVEECEKAGVNYKVGNIFSSDTFYDDANSGMDWAKMGVLGVEMESAALYCNAARAGKSVVLFEGEMLGGQILPTRHQADLSLENL